VNSVSQLIAHAKANPGKLNFGSPGNGTAMHLSGEMFKSAAGIDVVHVPYKGTQPVLTGLLAGEVAYTFDTGIAMEMVKAGRLKALAVTTPRRTALLPDLPTLAEAGLPGFASQSWYGFLAPAGTPPEVVAQLSRDINETLQGAAARERLARIVLEPQGTTPAQFEQFLKDDIVKWRQVIKESGRRPTERRRGARPPRGRRPSLRRRGSPARSRAPRERRRGPVHATRPFSRMTCRSARPIRRCTYLSITRIAWPDARSSARQCQISSRTSGARPSVASSRIRRRGSVTRARPIASICCSPPESWLPR
jgi:hypothetical protein